MKRMRFLMMWGGGAFLLSMQLNTLATTPVVSAPNIEVSLQKTPHFAYSEIEGKVNQNFVSNILIKQGEFIEELQILSLKGLPPGLTYNSEKQRIEGKPTKAGTFDVEARYNDKVKGSIKYGPGGYFTNHTDFVISE